MRSRTGYLLLAVGAVTSAALALVSFLGGLDGLTAANLASLSLLVVVAGLVVSLPWYVATAAEEGGDA
ncbi:hypothetical protein [Haloarchaeobius amylolyticus]|uniref:hypothetical protein n=1 Tax=Haloarchaeobius amylolyticus TaxID=1198296 RepID=UPI0022700160|nr:hypothetical protein [Haloarchaeobius amylolyticus]